MSAISPKPSDGSFNRRLSEISSYNSEVAEAFLGSPAQNVCERSCCKEVLIGVGISALSILVGIAALAAIRHICNTAGSSMFAGTDWKDTIAFGALSGLIFGIGGLFRVSQRGVVIGAAFGSGVISAFTVVLVVHLQG